MFHLQACVYTMCLCGAYGVKNRALETLELELGMVVSCCVGAGTQLQDLQRNSQCSASLSISLSSPSSCYFLKDDY